MNLPKIVYENLPFGYFALSGYLLFFHDSWQLFLSAAMLYCAGCVTLVARSEHRRLDKIKKHKKGYYFPTLVYEYLPYVYGAIALFIAVAVSIPWLQFIAFLLMVIALRNLVCRRNNRKKAPSLF